MKTIRLLLAAIVSTALFCIISSPKAHAEQGYAAFDFAVSKSQVAVGEEFTVSVYIIGRDNTQFGKAMVSIEAWYPNDPNPKGYEFVRFDGSGSDFPVSLGQGVNNGAYNYQCRYIERRANADMSGRHLFGRYVFRALNPGTYAFSPSQPCRNVIESLTGNWGIVWDYGNGYVTVNKPAPAAPSAPTEGTTPAAAPAGTPSASASKKVASSNTGNSPAGTQAAGQTPEGTVEGTQTVASNQSNQDTDKHSKNADSQAVVAKKHAGYLWAVWLVIPAALAALFLWKRRKNRQPKA